MCSKTDADSQGKARARGDLSGTGRDPARMGRLCRQSLQAPLSSPEKRVALSWRAPRAIAALARVLC